MTRAPVRPTARHAAGTVHRFAKSGNLVRIERALADDRYEVARVDSGKQMVVPHGALLPPEADERVISDAVCGGVVPT